MKKKVKIVGNTLSYDKYVTRKGTRYLRESLPSDDPDNLYNYLKTGGVRPEDHGIYHPDVEKFIYLSRNELIEHIIDLEDEIKQLKKAK